MSDSSKIASEILDGLMLSDGSMRILRSHKMANFRMKLSGKGLGVPSRDFLTFLEHIKKDCLEPLGIATSPGYPKVLVDNTSLKESLDVCWLQTLSSPLLVSDHTAWYPGYHGDGTVRKEVPEKLNLTPRSLAYWFMGDGSSSWNGSMSVTTTLYTQGFDEISIECLENQLLELVIHTGRGHKRHTEKGSGIIITVLQDSVNDFMRLVDPYVIEPYRYKIKYREYG